MGYHDSVGKLIGVIDNAAPPSDLGTPGVNGFVSSKSVVSTVKSVGGLVRGFVEDYR